MSINSQKTKTLVLTFLLIVLALSACGPREEEVDIDAQRTGFAQTADVQATMTAEALPTATVTNTPEPTFTSTPTQDMTATPTEDEEDPGDGTGAATPTATTISGVGSDGARWMANDPPDKTNFAPGEEFTVTWALENIGTSTWSTSYYIQFASGAQMDAEEKEFVPYPVAPKTNVKISVDFTAPADPGEYRSNWKLFNANDAAFYDFFIIIDVVVPGETEAPSATPTATSDAPTATVTATSEE